MICGRSLLTMGRITLTLHRSYSATAIERLAETAILSFDRVGSVPR